MKHITVTAQEANQRLDRLLLKYFGKAQKSFVYKMLRKKRIKLNGARAVGGEILQNGDNIQMYLADETVSALRSEKKTPLKETKISFKTLYEDRNILVVDKPAGILSQKEAESTKNSLVEQALFYLWEKGEYSPNDEITFVPALCNRLDRNTSGVVIIGKTAAALREMGKALQNGSVSKRYLVLVKGELKHGKRLKAFLQKDENTNTVTVSLEQTSRSKPILTDFEPIKANEKYSCLEVTLKTGRPHQIRAHLAFAGYPVIGDKKYGHKGTNMTFLRKYGLNRQFLHSHKIVFTDMEGDFSYLNGREVRSKLPKDLEGVLNGVFGDIF